MYKQCLIDKSQGRKISNNLCTYSTRKEVTHLCVKVLHLWVVHRPHSKEQTVEMVVGVVIL